jgi:hypothetical protein
MTLTPSEEDKLAAHLDTLDKKQLDNVSAHADIAHDDTHPHKETSRSSLAKWGAGILGVPVTVGLGLKIAKFIIRLR